MPSSLRRRISSHPVLGPPARLAARGLRRLRARTPVRTPVRAPVSTPVRAPVPPPPPVVPLPPVVPAGPPPAERVFLMDLPGHPDGRWTPSVAVVAAPQHFFVPKALSGGLGSFELNSVATFLTMCDLAPPGDVLDIGANTGIYSLLARTYGGRRTVAFEPVPELAAVARRLGHDNHVPFVVEESALGDAEGTATLYLSDRTDSSNSLRKGFRPSSRQIEVAVHTLDGYTTAHRLSPAVMKIDTETTEADVLRGGTEMLRRHRPWIVCEVLPGRGEAGVQAVLEQCGYRMHPITDATPFTRETTLVGRPEEYNWLFVPEEVPSSFWPRYDRWRAALASTVVDRPDPV